MVKIAESVRVRCFVRRSLRRFGRPSGAMGGSRLRDPQQSPPNHIQIRQRARHEQPMRVLLEPFVTRLGETEDPLDDQERMFDLGPHTGFGFVLGPLHFIDHALAPVAAVSHVLCVGCVVFNDLALPQIGRAHV